MSSTALPFQPAQPQANFVQRLCYQLIEKTLHGAMEGTLHFHLPDGTVQTFGDVQEVHPLTCTIQVKNWHLFERMLRYGAVGAAESYMAGEWDSPDLERVIRWFIRNQETLGVMQPSSAWAMGLLATFNKVTHWLRDNSVIGSRKNIAEHYDLSNDFFALWLDPTMTYSSALFKDGTESLEAAQIAKYDSLCQQLQFEPGMTVLEIGTGWGGFAEYAVSTYGIQLTTITISQEQFDYANQRLKVAGLRDQIDLRLQDYRHVTGQFDRIVSIEMLEAVGDKHYESYFGQFEALLKPNGLAAIQVITSPNHRFESLRKDVDFIQKHIFPGSLLPSLGRLDKAIQKVGSNLQLIKLTDLGHSYAKTLQTWDQRFFEVLPEVTRLGFDEHFTRKWHYYFRYCSAAFLERQISVVQALYSRSNNTDLEGLTL